MPVAHLQRRELAACWHHAAAEHSPQHRRLVIGGTNASTSEEAQRQHHKGAGPHFRRAVQKVKLSSLVGWGAEQGFDTRWMIGVCVFVDSVKSSSRTGRNDASVSAGDGLLQTQVGIGMRA